MQINVKSVEMFNAINSVNAQMIRYYYIKDKVNINMIQSERSPSFVLMKNKVPAYL